MRLYTPVLKMQGFYPEPYRVPQNMDLTSSVSQKSPGRITNRAGKIHLFQCHHDLIRKLPFHAEYDQFHKSAYQIMI